MAPGIALYASATKSKNEKSIYNRRQSFKTNKQRGNLEKNLGKDLATVNVLVVRIPSNQIIT